jgi:hypothetical protein
MTSNIIPGYVGPPNGGLPVTPTPTLPPWVVVPAGSLPGRDSINDTATPPGDRTASVSPQGTSLPICYGRDIIGPIVSLVKAVGTNLYLRLVWCLGEIDAIENITCNGDPIPTGATFTHYTGKATQGVDPTLASVIPGYADKCTIQIAGQTLGVAYTVAVIPANSNSGFPQFTAQIRGMKVRDPRGFGFIPNVDSTFAGFTVVRPWIGYEGTGHVYTRATGNRGTNAVASTDSSKGFVTGALQITTLGVVQKICEVGGGKLSIYVDTDNSLRVTGKNSSSVVVLDAKTVAVFKTGVSLPFGVSWDLTLPAVTMIIGQRSFTLQLGSVATLGGVINCAATGISIGGEYSTTNNQLDGILSGLNVQIGTYFSLLTQAGRATLYDSNYRVLNVVGTTLNAYDGYGNGFTYTNTPATQNDDTATWSFTGGASKDRYCAPGLTGGMYVYSSNLGSFPMTLTPTGGVLGSLPMTVYTRADFTIGGLKVSSSVAGQLMAISGTNNDGLYSGSFNSAGETFSVVGDAAINSILKCVLRQFYVCPQALNFYSQFIALTNGNEWTVLSGTATQNSLSNGGLLLNSASTDVIQAVPYFYTGEVVSYQISVSGTFTGSVAFKCNAVTFLTVSAPGLYTGTFTAGATKVEIVGTLTVNGAIVDYVQLKTSTASKIWTQTPALMLADLLESSIYGLGSKVNNQSLFNMAKYNEQIVPLSTQKRVQIGLSLMQQDAIQNWIETFRAYARCFISARDDTIYLIPDAPYTGTIQSVTAGDMVAGSFKISKKSLSNLPNVVRVYYMNTAQVPWIEAFVDATLPTVQSGLEFPRVSELRMNGFQDKSTAYRYAVERLNNTTLIDTTGAFDALDTMFPVEPGDVINVTHPCGLVASSMRVLSCDASGRGKMTLSYTSYNVNVYSDQIVDDPQPIDFKGASPFEVPAITGLAVTEEFYNTGTSTSSRLRVVWTAISYPYLQFYYIQIYEDGVVIQSAYLRDPLYLHNNAQVGHQYHVSVQAISITFVQGLASSVYYTALGNLLPPDFSAGQIVAFEGADSIQAYVRIPAVDIDLWGYEWRYRKVWDQNLFPPGSYYFNTVDWAGSGTLGNFDFGFGSNGANKIVFSPGDSGLIFIQSVSSGTAQLTSPLPAGFVAGKSYDIYMQLQQVSGLLPGSGGITGNLIMPGGVAGQDGYSLNWDKTTPLGVMKLTWTPTSSDLSGSPLITVKASAGASLNQRWRIAYIAIRENVATVAGDWSTAQIFTRETNGSIQVNNVPTASYIIYARALDSVRSAANPYGQYSADIKTAFVNIISDASSYQRTSFPLTFGSATNFPLYPQPVQSAGAFLDNANVLEQVGIYIPDKGSTWNTIVAGTVNAVATPLWGAFKPTSGTPVWNSTTYDLLATITGTVTINFQAQSIVDGISNVTFWLNYKILTTDSWTRVQALTGIPTNFQGRYVMVEVDAATNKSAGFLSNSAAHITVDATPRIETGSLTTNGPDGSGNPVPITVLTTGNYSSIISIDGFTNTGESIKVFINNATPGSPSSFDMIALNLRGFPVAVQVNWKFRGV